MKRGFVIAVGGAAIVGTALAGCGDKNDKSSASQSASVSVPGGAATVGAGKATVKVDGNEQKVEGTVICAPVGDINTITIGNPGAQQGATVVLTTADPPDVNQVALYFGTPITYQKGSGGDATAKKDGKTYSVSGHSTPMPDVSNPTAEPKGHEFALDITCS